MQKKSFPVLRCWACFDLAGNKLIYREDQRANFFFTLQITLKMMYLIGIGTDELIVCYKVVQPANSDPSKLNYKLTMDPDGQ